MRYLGGKHRTAKHIAAYLESVRAPGQVFLEYAKRFLPDYHGIGKKY